MSFLCASRTARKYIYLLVRSIYVVPDYSVEKTIFSYTKKITNLGRAGAVHKALELFEKMPHRNQVSWNAMLTILLESHRLEEARLLFRRIPQPNSTSYTLIITGLSRSGLVSEASEVFRSIPNSYQNVISWTAIISCYTLNHQPLHAVQLFASSYGEFCSLRIIPNAYTFSILLKACSQLESLVTGVQIHGMIIKLSDEESEHNVFVLNSLIDLHTKVGSLSDAERIFIGMKWTDLSSWNIMMDAYARHLLIDRAFGIFSSMEEKDTLSWNIMISGLAECNRGVEALELFIQLLRAKESRLEPNPSTYTTVLSVCATLALLEFGAQIHALTLKCGLLHCNVYIGNSLLNMYAKCGSIEEADKLFTDMSKKDIVSWNSLILSLGQNGFSRKAVDVGENVLKAGIGNHNTFIGLLTSCSHGGLVDEGMEYFNSMTRVYGINPTLDHYNCVIDMLGRSGRVAEAHDLLCKMPFAPNAVTWGVLLSASLLHRNEKIGELAAGELRSLDPNNAASYVMLANIYGSCGHVEKSRHAFGLMKKLGLKKEYGVSWIP